MSDNKSLQIKKEGIIEKIFSFFRNIILKSKNEQIENTNEVVLESDNYKTGFNFNESLKVKPKEEPKILKIQKKYENNEVKLSELSNKEIHYLNILYQKQVLELEKSLSKKLEQLKSLKNKNAEENS